MTVHGAGRKALQQTVYESLKMRIIEGELAPGQVICEERLARDFGTSRTPIRESLLRLQRENLVDIYPRQGTFVSRISPRDVREIYDIRLLIEPRTTREALLNLDPRILDRFSEEFRSMDLGSVATRTWFHHDRSFHDYLVECSHNATLVRIYTGVMDQHLRVRILAGRLPNRLEQTNEEHLHIIEALKSRDGEAVERSMTEHLSASREAALKVESLFTL